MSPIPTSHKASLVRAATELPSDIEYAEIDAPQVTGSHDVIIKNKFAGVNFIDAYFRKGLYPTEYPLIFGREASGVVAAIGDQVSKYKVGDKVAYMSTETFAQYTKIPDSLVSVKILPETATDEDLKQWAAILLQGLTAITLPIEAYEVKKDDVILVWAAAGGVGQILTKYTKSLGARVIAVASSDEKLQDAKNAGAEFLVKSSDDVVARVNEITDGKGVRAVFDGVGKDTFDASLASLGRRGMLVTYGNSSGAIPPFNVNRLTDRNLKISRLSVFGSVATQEDWDFYTNVLQEALEKKVVDAPIYKTYPLSEYAQATEDLEGRKTSGKLVVEIP